MKKTFWILITAAGALSGCQRSGPVDLSSNSKGPAPESWYVLPEDGKAKNQGSLEKLGNDVNRLFAFQAMNIASLGKPATAPADHPVDWVPWHLAVLSQDFALSSEGVLGALFFAGSASIQAKWVRRDSLQGRSLAKASVNQKPSLRISGTATREQVAKEIEPVIAAAIAGGKVHNEASFRKTVQTAAEDFRALATDLSSLNVAGIKFPPTAFTLEIKVNSEGELTPLFGLGGAVGFRFDWIIKEKEQGSAREVAAPASPLGRNLANLVRSLAPDIEVAAQAAGPIHDSGFKLSKIRIGLGITSGFQIGLANSSAEGIGSIIFGDNGDEGGCEDPDGDGDCHNEHESFASSLQHAEGTNEDIPLIENIPSEAHLRFAAAEGVPFQKFTLLPNAAAHGAESSVVYRIPHKRFQAGLKKAIKLSSFFTKHAAKVNGNWVIKELSTEFAISLTGTTGLVTVGGVGELELEFEKEGS